MVKASEPPTFESLAPPMLAQRNSIITDNSDLTSSVSFNTSTLYDNLDNMDSISQVMAQQAAMEQNDQPIDLSNLTAEIQKRDKKINELMTDRVRFKKLLQKAKTTIDSINKKYK